MKKILAESRPEDWTLLIILGFASYGAVKVIPTLRWFSWIIPGVFIILGGFYFFGRVVYDEDEKQVADED